MKVENYSWLSTNLNKEMPLSIYGHYGFFLLLFPALSDVHTECKDNGLIDSIIPSIKKGRCRVVSITGNAYDSWLNSTKTNKEKSLSLLNYNNYLTEELLPFLFNQYGGIAPIITCGAAIGAFYAANTYFRRPDLLYGTIALSGTFNIQHFSNNYFDDNCYFNSPIHYLPNLEDPYWLSYLKSKHHVYLLSGSGEGEYPENSLNLSNILKSKEIRHHIEIWGYEWAHNWETWNTMLPYFLENKM